MALSDCAGLIAADRRELRAHGTASFPLACYWDDLRRAAVPWHWHDEWEAAVVSEGQALVSLGRHTHLLGPGDGFFLNAGTLHDAKPAGAGASRLHSLVFHPRLVGGSADSVFWQKYVQPLLADRAWGGMCLRCAVPWQQALLARLDGAWQSCRDEPPGYELTARSLLSAAVGALALDRPESEPLSPKYLRDSGRIKIMLGFIRDHAGESLTAAQIAASAAVSESECLRCFHSMLGVTPIQYLRQVRLQAAAQLLQTTDRSIADIGSTCGFGDMSYFSREFRRCYGFLPSDPRARTPGLTR